MEKSRSSFFLSLMPWLSPRTLKFVPVNGGIEVQLWKSNRVVKEWHPSHLRSVLPEVLSTWMAEQHFHEGPQPYPLAKQLWQHLQPIVSKRLIIDASALDMLEEIRQPPDFALVWTLQHLLERIEGYYAGADRYLGMGWFQKDAKVWSLHNPISPAIDAQLKNMNMPVQQADTLLNTVIPQLQQYLPNRVNFQLVRDFVVRVNISDMRRDRLTCGLECNYPQLLSTIRVPRQNSDLLLANQALIRFPSQALTPVLTHLLQRAGSPITLQGPDIPLFISEQLPIMRHFYQINGDTATRIAQSYPIVPISELNPTFTLVHQYKNGIGSYTSTATYQYQQYPLDMPALLAAYQGQQRFVQQHAIWFEWPANAHGLAKAIQQDLAIHPLRVEEIMGLDTRRSALISNQAPGQTIVPDGTTPIERAQSIFEQLRHHGIPGGIVGEPKELTTMFVKVSEKLLREYQQAHILWLIPSNKKGSVTRVVHRSTVDSHVVVASLVTLRDEPALISRAWTLIIFQELDVLLYDSPQSRTLSQLTWQWALISVPSRQAITPPAMRVLHIHEQYYEDFRTRYLFDLTLAKTVPAPGKRPLDLDLEKIASLQVKTVPAPGKRSLDLDLEKIASLQAESEQLQERLTVEEETEPRQLVTVPASASTQVAPAVSPTAVLPQVDEDWQIILQQWQPEHWEILRLLCQGQAVHLSRAERQSHRPLSRLIDEINMPVDEQLGDLLIDPDTQTLAPHLRTITEKLVGWYASS